MRNTTRQLGLQYFCDKLTEHGIQYKLQGRGVTLLITETKDKSLQNTIPVKVYCGSGEHFSLLKKHEYIRDLVLGYVWDIDLDPSVFLMTFEEAYALLGDKARSTRSWADHGYYSWSSASGLPKGRWKVMVDCYKDRWGWLRNLVAAHATTLAC